MDKRICPVELEDLSLSEAQTYIREKYRVNALPARIRRWIRRGLVSHNGCRVYLRAKRQVCWYTCSKWIDMFIKKQGEQEQKSTQNTRIGGSTDPEKLIPLLAARKYIKKTYQRNITLPTLRNWCIKGRVSNSDRRYILEAHKRSGVYSGWYTTIKHINQFICELDT